MQAQGPAKMPAVKGVMKHVQPNGDTLRIYLHGDERMHWRTTEDGWRIVYGKSEWLYYAKKNRKGEIVKGCRKAHNAEDRSRCEKRWLEKKGVKG